MILILKDADFSANNIGHIDLPVDLDDLTKTVLENMTKYGVSSMQAQFLNTYILTLKNGGILAKLKYLHLPIFADSLGEAFYNIIDGADESPTVVTPYEIRDYGYGVKESFTGITGYDAHFKWTKLFSSGESVGNLSCGVYRGELSNNSRAIMGSSAAPYLTIKANSVSIGLSPNYAGVTNIGSNTCQEQMDALSFDGSSILINYGGTKTGEAASAGTIPTITNNWLNRVCYNGYALTQVSQNEAHTATVSMMFAGHSLTQTELDLIADSTTTLVTAIKGA